MKKYKRIGLLQLSIGIIALFMSCVAHASSLISEDKIWEYYTKEDYQIGNNREFTRYQFIGTEQVGEKVYNKLIRIYEKGDIWSSETNWKYVPYETFEQICVALMREEGDKVYMLLDPELKYDSYVEEYIFGEPYNHIETYHDSNEGIERITLGDEIVLYDFSESPEVYETMSYMLFCKYEYNDRAFRNLISYAHKTGYDSIMVNDREYRVFKVIHHGLEYLLSDNWELENYELKYIREFGNIGRGNLFQLTNKEAYICIASYLKTEETTYLNRVLDLEGNVLYSTPETIDPSAIHEINTDNQDTSRIYDLMGREIRNPQPGTVYIRGGKKYVAK